jgi:metal-responsive CopG/Arc/MetJ family transcriptional regulator
VKLAVSIPDPLYEAADQLARHRKVSRSELYASALELLLAAESDTDITSRLDLVYAAQPTRDETPAKQRVIAVRESW